MKPFLVPSRLLACVAGLIAAASALAQTIPNPSFEADTFTVFPGYISGNAPITGWTANNTSRAGLNPGGGSPFADNGTIPDGANVAFIQSGTAGGTTLSTVISGLSAGQAYKVSFRCNARGGQTPILKVEIDGTLIESGTVASVGGSLPYKYFVFDFTASDVTANLTLRNDAGGDNTVCVDDFRIAVKNSGWSWAAWNNNATSGVDGSKTYTHAFNFGSAANAVINGITFTGRAGANPSVAGSFAMGGLPNVFNNDGNNVTDAGGSRTLANDFIYGGSGNNVLETLTINGLFPGGEYIATIYSVGWENGPVRAATFSVGTDRLTINQDRLGDNNGIRYIYHFVASSSSIVISYEPLQAATIHTYGFSVQQVSLPAAPTISKSPSSQCVGDGTSVSFSVTAAGTAPLSYEWRKDDVAISGETNPTYNIPSVTTGDAGTYTVVVSNPSGSVTSSPAILQVGIPITNPSFEVDTFTVFPYYVSGNFPITGWSSLGNHGVNSAAGPFADNGIIPDGNQVAFMQGDGALSQLITGFTPGLDYYVIYYENSRTGPTIPGLEVKVGDTTVVQPHVVPQVGANPYVKVLSESFTADTDTIDLSFIKSNPQGGDTTALIDYVCILELQPGTPLNILDQPRSQIVSVGQSVTFRVRALGSQPVTYEWLKDGVVIPGATDHSYTISGVVASDEAVYSVRITNPSGPVVSADASLTVYVPIPDLFGTGLDNTHSPLADNEIDSHYRLITNPDGASADAIVEQSGAFPIVTGPWLPNDANSKWIGPRFNTAAAAGGRYVYRTTIDLTDRDLTSIIIDGRWSVDNTGVDILVNGVSTANPQNPGFNVWTDFTIRPNNATFVDGVNTIDFVADNAGAGYCGLKVEILRSNVRIPPGIPPTITSQPQSRTVIAGDPASFGVVALGSLPLTYAWQKDGVDLPTQTNAVLLISSVSQADVGVYTVRVSNDAGDAFSDLATLCISYTRVPGVVFGTGVDDTGALAVNGTADLHYILSESVDPDFQGPDALVVDDTQFPISTGNWVASGPKSKWIAPSSVQTNGNLEGNYTFQTFFDLTGYDLSQAKVVGAWAVDNFGLDILVNGLSTGITSPGFGGMTAFTLPASSLVAGPNVLDFKMNNAPSGVNPTGLRVDLELLIPNSPTLTISKSQAGIVVSWAPTSPCQRLMQADDVAGPWTPAASQANPNTVDGSSPARFFKVVQ
jgi:hypothetical protein